MKNLRLAALAVLMGLGHGMLHGQLTSVGPVNVEKFPSVAFAVNDRDPEDHPEGFFQVKDEDGKALEFTVKSSIPDDSGVAKSILVIWEYLPSKARDAQNKYFRQLLSKTLPSILDGDADEVSVATFAWTQGAQTLTHLRDAYGQDTATLRQLVLQAKAPSGKGIDKEHGSELYPAISEGIKSLAAQKNKAKVLVVLSAEFPNIYNQNVDVSMCKDQALSEDVAIYNLRYKVMNEKYTLDALAHDTYGLSNEVPKDNVAAASGTLNTFMDGAIRRSLGKDYSFTTETAVPKDGAAHALQLVGGKNKLEVDFESPGLSFGEWIGQNLALFIGLIVLLLGSVVGIFLWMRKRKQAEAARQAEEERKIAEANSRSQANEERISQQNQQLSQMQQQKQEEERRAAEAKRKEETEREMKALLTEMYANGKHPRLTTMVDGQPVTMELPSPVTTVGRDPSCDVRFNLTTISRNHFQIIYQGGKYTLMDLGSTNGTSLNGSRVQAAELRHGDEISAGGAILHFFI